MPDIPSKASPSYRLASPFDLQKLEWSAQDEAACKYFLQAGDRSFYVPSRIAEFLEHITEPDDDATDVSRRLSGLKDRSGMSNEESLILEKLVSMGVIVSDEVGDASARSESAKARQYIAAQVSILPKRVVHALPEIFKHLFSPWCMALTVILGAAVSYRFLASNVEALRHPIISLSSWLLHLNGLEFAISFALGIAVSVFHEIGHVSAARYFGAKVSRIGFGFYLFSPVFYSDVTAAWALRPRQRVIVNLGGVYFEFIFISIVAVIAAVTHLFILKIIYFIRLISIAANLVPFFRTDGFWIYCDMLQIHNMRQHVLDLYSRTFTRQKGNARKAPGPSSRRAKAGVLLYAIALPLVITFYLYSGVLFYIQFLGGIHGVFETAIDSPTSRNIVHAFIACIYLAGLVATPFLIARRIRSATRSKQPELRAAT